MSFKSYRTLDSKKQEIRLLKLNYVYTLGILTGTFEYVSLAADPTPRYRALSYCWGPPDASRQILIHGQWVSVSRTVFEMLKTVSTQSSNDLFWLDLLCINQECVREKNQQVSFMFDIFRNASKVIAWLGVGSAHFDFALEYALKYANGDEDTRIWERSQARDWFLNIFQNPYWGRTSIVQECVAAKSLYLLYGSKMVAWDIIADIMENFVEGEGSYDEQGWSETLMQPGMVYERLQHTMKELAQRPTWRLAVYFKNHLCQNRRDAIYAMRGMSCDQADIAVDYNLSLVEVLESAISVPLRVPSRSFEKDSLGYHNPNDDPCPNMIYLDQLFEGIDLEDMAISPRTFDRGSTPMNLLVDYLALEICEELNMAHLDIAMEAFFGGKTTPSIQAVMDLVYMILEMLQREQAFRLFEARSVDATESFSLLTQSQQLQLGDIIYNVYSVKPRVMLFSDPRSDAHSKDIESDIIFRFDDFMKVSSTLAKFYDHFDTPWVDVQADIEKCSSISDLNMLVLRYAVAHNLSPEIFEWRNDFNALDVLQLSLQGSGAANLCSGPNSSPRDFGYRESISIHITQPLLYVSMVQSRHWNPPAFMDMRKATHFAILAARRLDLARIRTKCSTLR